MYAIVEIGGKQFRAEKEKRLKVPLLQMDAGKKVQFDRILVIEDDKGNISIGTPVVANNAVTAEVVEHGREKKIIVFHKKRRKGFQKKNGHRQDYSIIQVKDIGAVKADKSQTAKEEKAVKTTAKPVEEQKKTSTKAAAPAKKTTKAAASKSTAATKKTAPRAAGKPSAAAAAKKTAAAKTASKSKKTSTTAKKTPAAKKSGDVKKEEK